MAERIVDWDHVYLLGWYDETGRSYLSTWDGDHPYVYVVVTHLGGRQMPLWKAPVPRGAELQLVPDMKEHQERVAYATSKGGFLAIAWYIEDGFQRGPRCTGTV